MRDNGEEEGRRDSEEIVKGEWHELIAIRVFIFIFIF